MKKKYISFTFIIIALTELVVGILFYKRMKNFNYTTEELYTISRELINCKSREQNRRENNNFRLFTEGNTFSNIDLLNSEGEKVVLSDVIMGKVLIYRFYRESCPPCIEQNFEIIKKLSDSIGFENIIIISNFNKPRLHKAFILNNYVNCKSFLYPSRFIIPMETDTTLFDPYYFVLNSELKISFPYFADPDDSLTSTYFVRIKELFR